LGVVRRQGGAAGEAGGARAGQGHGKGSLHGFSSGVATAYVAAALAGRKRDLEGHQDLSEKHWHVPGQHQRYRVPVHVHPRRVLQLPREPVPVAEDGPRRAMLQGGGELVGEPKPLEQVRQG